MILEMLARYGRNYDFQKSKLYDTYKKKHHMLKSLGYDFKVKTSFDLYTFEILAGSFENEQKINEAINQLNNQNEDVLRHLNYQERRRFYQQEIPTIVENLPRMVFEHNIYLPYHSQLINDYLIRDHEALGLKKYQLLLKSQNRDYRDMIDEYGLAPYASDFCSLELLGENEVRAAFYSKEFNLIYLVGKDDFDIHELVLKDKWFKGEYEKSQIEKLAKMIIANDDPILIYDYLVTEGLLSDKFIKKMEKKWRK